MEPDIFFGNDSMQKSSPDFFVDAENNEANLSVFSCKISSGSIFSEKFKFFEDFSMLL